MLIRPQTSLSTSEQPLEASARFLIPKHPGPGGGSADSLQSTFPSLLPKASLQPLPLRYQLLFLKAIPLSGLRDNANTGKILFLYSSGDSL